MRSSLEAWWRCQTWSEGKRGNKNKMPEAFTSGTRVIDSPGHESPQRTQDLPAINGDCSMKLDHSGSNGQIERTRTDLIDIHRT
jgi:hypothetical protein